MGAVRIERDAGVVRITLARPERRNALDPAAMAQLVAAFEEAADARAIVLAGEGSSFCAGGDVEWLRASADFSFDEAVESARPLRELMEAVDGCPAPVVARVHGYALGGGSGVVACCDVAIASRDAVFGLTEVRLGIVPAVISPFVLARIGTGAARRLFVTGEQFDAETALRIGLVHELADDLDAAVERVVAALLAGGPEAVRAAKKSVSTKTIVEVR